MDQVMNLFKKQQPIEQNRSYTQPSQPQPRYQPPMNREGPYNPNRNKYNFNAMPNTVPSQMQYHQNEINQPGRNISPMQYEQEGSYYNKPQGQDQPQAQGQGRASRIKNNLMQFANQAPYQNMPMNTNPVQKPNYKDMRQNQRYQKPTMNIEANYHYGDDDSDYVTEKAFVNEYNNTNQYFAPKEKEWERNDPGKRNKETSKERKTNQQQQAYNQQGKGNNDMDMDMENDDLQKPRKGRLGKKTQPKPKGKAQMKTKDAMKNKEIIYERGIEEEIDQNYYDNTNDQYDDGTNYDKDNEVKEKVIEKLPQKEPSKKDLDLSKYHEQQKNKRRSVSPITNPQPKIEIIPTDLSNRQPLNKDDQSAISSISKAQLQYMCSDNEIIERETQNLLSIFELDASRSTIDPISNIESKKANPEHAIKAYFRPGGDLNKYDPENIRTPKVLKQTMDYILINIVDSDIIPNPKFPQSNKISFSEICLFVNDRFRAIRQDFTVQKLKGNRECIQCHEYIARFLILCLNETLDVKAISGQQGLYNLNMTQLNSTLTSLNEFYEDSHREKLKNTNTNEEIYISPDEEEFLSYFILIALKQKPIEFCSIISKIPKHLHKGKYITQALNISKTVLNNDWNGFMKILRSKDCDYLTSCLMVLFFTDIRFRALNELSYATRPPCAAYLVSIDKLCTLLPFEDQSECIKFLEWFGIEVSYSNVENTKELFTLIKGDSRQDLNFIHAPNRTNHRYVQIKKGSLTRKEIVLGNNNGNFNRVNINVPSLKQVDYFKRPSLPKMNISLDLLKNKQTKPQPSLSSKTDKVEVIVLDSQKTEPIITIPVTKHTPVINPEQPKQTTPTKSIDNSVFYAKVSYFISQCTMISKLYGINHKLSFFSNMKVLQEQYVTISKFQKQQEKQRKHQIFAAWRKAHIKIKYNTLYMKELIKYNINISSIENSYTMLSKTQFAMYNFDELQYFLIQSYKSNHDQSMDDDSSLIHLQVNFYTTKHLMESTQILQHLHVDAMNIQSRNEEIVISSKMTNDNKIYWIFLRFIFLDQIALSSIEKYIYSNQQNLSKFSYGIIFFDYTNKDVINTLITLLDQSLGKYIKKKFIFGFEISNTLSTEQFNAIHDSYLWLAKRYQYNDDNYQHKTIFLGNLSSFSSYFTDLLIYHNNTTFISLFKDNTILSFQSFRSNLITIPLKQVNHLLRYEYFTREMKVTYPFSRNNFLIEETLLSISIIKIISEFYKTKLSNDLNEMLNIPLFLTSTVMTKNETILIKLVQFFDCITSIDLVNIACFMQNIPKSYIESPLAYFDVLVRHIRDFDFDLGIDYATYRNAIVKYEYDVKKKFALSINHGMMHLVTMFYSEIIEFLSNNLDIEINWSNEDREILKVIFSEMKGKALREIQESITNLVIKDMIPQLKINEMLARNDQPTLLYDSYDHYSFLNKKRKRFEDNEYSKQFSLEFIQHDNDYNNPHKSLSFPHLNYFQRADFNLKPSLVSYISQ